MIPHARRLIACETFLHQRNIKEIMPLVQRHSTLPSRHPRSIRYAEKLSIISARFCKRRSFVVHYSTTHGLFAEKSRAAVAEPAVSFGSTVDIASSFDDVLPSDGRKYLLPNGKLISVGMTAEKRKTFTSEEVKDFARISTDTNPIHIDQKFAEKTRFGRCIVHGALTNGLVSGVVGTELPGAGCIVLRQLLKFPNPLFVGEAVAAQVKLVEIYENRVRLIYRCISLDSKTADISKKTVMEGEALLVIPHMKMVS